MWAWAPDTGPALVLWGSAWLSLWGRTNSSSTKWPSVSVTISSRTRDLEWQYGNGGRDAGLRGSGWAQSRVAG